MAFHVGQKVQCVKRGPWVDMFDGQIDHDDFDPKFGDILTVSKVLVHGTESLLFVGINEAMYLSSFFIPLQESGMSILRSIAANPKQKVDA